MKEITHETHETHDEYILDVLEDEQERLTEVILDSIPFDLKYSVYRLVEVITEKVELSNKVAN